MDPVLEVIEAANQRGGRMLSIPDLVAAGTLSAGQAAWLLDRIREGSSWLVGARPGGAGKTTIMCALLCHLPANTRIRVTTPYSGWRDSAPGECLTAYEIGPGPYSGYIWGAEVRAFARLGRSGVRIVANLHADTIEEARRQVVGECGATEDEFQAFDLFLPITLRRAPISLRREVRGILRAEGGAWRPVPRSEAEKSASADSLRFVNECLETERFTIREVRRAWLRHIAE